MRPARRTRGAAPSPSSSTSGARPTCDTSPPTSARPAELRSDLTDDEGADLVWAMNSPQFFRLVTPRGRDYAASVADVWTRTLLADPPR